MLIEWNENTSQRQGDDGWVWSITASVGGVSVTQTRQWSRTLGAMRSDVMEAVAAALGLDPATVCEYSDGHSLRGCMEALRRMAKEAERQEAAEHNAKQEALVVGWKAEQPRSVAPAVQEEEPDTIEAVATEWEEAGGGVVRCGDFVRFISEEECVAAWDTDAHDGAPLRYPGPAWAHGTLNDLRAALGLEVKR